MSLIRRLENGISTNLRWTLRHTVLLWALPTPQTILRPCDKIVDCLTWLEIANDHVWSTWRLSFQNLKVEWKWKSCQCEGSRSFWLSCMPFPFCLTSKFKRWWYVVHTPWGSRMYSAHCPTFEFPFDHEIGMRLLLQAITSLLVFFYLNY